MINSLRGLEVRGGVKEISESSVIFSEGVEVSGALPVPLDLGEGVCLSLEIFSEGVGVSGTMPVSPAARGIGTIRSSDFSGGPRGSVTETAPPTLVGTLGGLSGEVEDTGTLPDFPRLGDFRPSDEVGMGTRWRPVCLVLPCLKDLVSPGFVWLG